MHHTHHTPATRTSRRAPGAQQATHELRRRQAQVYAALDAACRRAQDEGTADVVVGGRRFFLASGEPTNYYLNYHAFLRLRDAGLVFCRVCEKDAGHQEALLPFGDTLWLSHGAVAKKRAAVVTRVEDARTGATLFFDPATNVELPG